jgi:hypothetical protein
VPSSLHVPSFSKPGSKASSPSSPSKSNFKLCIAHDVMSIHKGMPVVIAQL